MTSCAHEETPRLPDSFYACPVPEAYPENPNVAELIYALNDTYLAWEECRGIAETMIR